MHWMGKLAVSTLTAAVAIAAVPQQEARIVSPGAKELQPAKLAVGRWSTAFYRVVNGQDSVAGAPYSWDIGRTRVDGRDVIASVQFSNGPDGGRDSTLIDARTLSPVAFRARNPSDTVAVEFRGGTYVAKRQNAKHGARSGSGGLERLAFDATALDLVIGALPLKEGYSARLPVITPTGSVDSIGSVTWQTVRVLGSAETQDRATWKVEIITSRNTRVAQIDKETGAMLDARMQIPKMGELHMVRSPVSK